MMNKTPLTVDNLLSEANSFSEVEAKCDVASLYGVTDGKAVGTYLEHKFRDFLEQNYVFDPGNSARGIDFPSIEVDMKVTSVRQPQSSCPYRSARQKIYGLGYGLLVFVYEKSDDHDKHTGRLNIRHTVFVEKARTADYQMTRGLREILDRDANIDDLIAFMTDKNLPVDDIEVNNIAEEILKKRPEQEYLTISNALQWRLQYRRVISHAGTIEGIARVR